MDLHALFADVPWFLPALKTIIAAATLWFLVAPFARWVLLLTGGAVAAVRRYLAARAERVGSRVGARRDEIKRARRALAERNTAVDVTAATVWRRAVRELSTPIQDQVQTQRGLATALRQLQRRFERAGARHESTLELPDEPLLANQVHRYRAATLQFYGVLLFLIIAGFANATFSSRVIRELGVTGPSLFGPRLPLAYVLAFALAVVEAAVGFLHGISKDREVGDERRLSGEQLLWSSAGLVVMAFEAWLYSLVIPTELQDRESVFGLPPSAAFAILGGLFGLSMWGCASKLYTSRVARIRNHTPRSLHKDVVRLHDALDDLNSTVKQLQTNQKQLQEGFDPIAGGGLSAGSLERVENAAKYVRDSAEHPPAWSRGNAHILTDSDMSEREGRWALWFLLVAISAVAATVAFSAVLPWRGLGGWAVGLGLSLGFVAAGLVLASAVAPHVRVEIELRGELHWSRPATLVIALLPFVLPLLVVLLMGFSSGSWRPVWLFTLPAAALLVVSARELGALIFLLPLQVKKAIAFLGNVGDRVPTLFATGILALLLALRAALYVVAAPLLAFLPIPSAAKPNPDANVLA